MCRSVSLVLVTLVLLPLVPLQAQPAQQEEPPVRYDPDVLTPAFHRERRQALKAALPPNTVALFFSAPIRRRENDVDFEYRQDSDLYYLTGTHEPASVLLLAPSGLEIDGETVTEVLMVPSRTAFSDVWLGRRYGAARAQEELGLQKVMGNERYVDLLTPLLNDETLQIYHLPLPNDVEATSDLGEQVTLLKEKARRRAVDDNSLRRMLDGLRMTKQDDEVALLQRAIDITVTAHVEAMKSIEPGMHEYEAEALIEYIFRRNGAEYSGFPSIVGSGENAVILHYNTNRRRMEAPDMVVIDIGAEYRGYSADITRTLPVDGVFTPEQRTIYEIVLNAQQAGIEASRAGAPFNAPDQAARLVVARGLFELGLIEGVDEVNRFFMHGTSHYLGLMVHDVGTGGDLTPGTVITVEPGIYITPSEEIDPKWWNIGVRIEDDVLITDGDPLVLSAKAPRTVEEIEALMKEKGLGNDPAGRTSSQ